MGASILVATHSRYVVYMNRPPDGASLYPGQSVTGLCPVDTFDATPIYAAGDVPDEAEIAARRDAVWVPYHAQLRAELDRIRAQHVALRGLPAPAMLSAHVFASHRTSAIDSVWVGGACRVAQGRHALHDSAASAFAAARASTIATD